MKENCILKRKVFIIALLGLIISGILIGCQNDDSLPETKSTVDEAESEANKEQQSITELTSEIESLQAQSEYLNEEKQYFATVIKEIIADFTEEEMLKFSQDQIIYDLTVNGESIPKSGQVTIPTGDVKILLSERVRGYDFLPSEWIDRGRISENYIDQILNFDTTNWTPLMTDGTVVTGQGYQATNMKAGERFSFNITDELKERLNLDTNTIQIEIN
ncbi:hypothetical protein ACIQ2D_04875 [Lysinibacillus sp. NPDC097287]|uniref:hypothetical protein n=1 Tax=Lysinibacillus sp. NPDC097287 TaxID=3364144 RepID=UPI00382D9796